MAILYSVAFEQIISVSVDECVRLWDVHKGKLIFEFTTKHGAPVTCACLDTRGKRLLTGAHNGTVYMWNFNNGAMMTEFAPRQKEIHQLMFLKRSSHPIIGVGWEAKLLRWADTQQLKAGGTTQDGHTQDISAMCTNNGNTLLVTGTDQGELILWNVDSKLFVKRFLIPSAKKWAMGGRRASVTANIKVSGVSALALLEFCPREDASDDQVFTLLVVGTDSGQLWFADLKRTEFVACINYVFTDVLVGIAFNGMNTPVHTRLMCIDSAKEAKMFDLSELNIMDLATTLRTAMSQPLRHWQPHPEANSLTCLQRIDQLKVFLTGSENGDISCWTDQGECVYSLGQRGGWTLQVREVQGSDKIMGDSDSDSEEEVKQRMQKEELSKIRGPRYLEPHPSYVPKQMNKQPLRSAGFDLTPKKVEQPKPEENSWKGVSLYHKLTDLEQQLAAKAEAARLLLLLARNASTLSTLSTASIKGPNNRMQSGDQTSSRRSSVRASLLWASSSNGGGNLVRQDSQDGHLGHPKVKKTYFVDPQQDRS